MTIIHIMFYMFYYTNNLKCSYQVFTININIKKNNKKIKKKYCIRILVFRVFQFMNITKMTYWGLKNNGEN